MNTKLFNELVECENTLYAVRTALAKGDFRCADKIAHLKGGLLLSTEIDYNLDNVPSNIERDYYLEVSAIILIVDKKIYWIGDQVYHENEFDTEDSGSKCFLTPVKVLKDIDECKDYYLQFDINLVIDTIKWYR